MTKRTRAVAAALTLCAALAAQSPLSTTYASTHYLQSLDGGVYFDLVAHADLRIERLDVNLLSPPGTAGTLEVWLRPATWAGHVVGAADWVLASQGSVVAAGPDQPSPCTLQQPIGLPPGGYGIAVRHRGVMPLYTLTLLPSRSFANADVRLTAGGSSLWFLGSAPFLGRVFNGAIHYTLGGGPYTFATAIPFGEGCYRRARSFYEAFAPGAFDLQHARFELVPNLAGGFDVARVPPLGIALPPSAQNLQLARGGAAVVPLPATRSFPGGATSSLIVYANGRVLLWDAGVPLAPPAGLAGLLGHVPALGLATMDLAPAGAANVYVHTDGTAGTVTVTWWDVPESGAAATAGGNTFCLRSHADGRFELEFAAVLNHGSAQPCLIGFGAGGSPMDPGPRDLSASAAFATHADDPGLGLVAEGRPVPGTTTTLQARGVPAGALAAAMLLAFDALPLGRDLRAVGAPGCSAFVDPSTVAWTGLVPTAAPRLPVPVPMQSALLGFTFVAQALALAPGANAAGAVTSNGVLLQIGAL